MAEKKLNIAESVTPTAQRASASSERRALGKKLLEEFMKDELRLVKGIFQNFETPGMALPVHVKKYPGHVFNRVLEDGKEYEIPLYVARHLNGIDVTAREIDGKLGTCSYEVHQYIVDKNGIPIVSRQKRKHRFGFQSLEFGNPFVAA